MKTTGVIVIALAMLIALTGVAMADQVFPAYGNIVSTGSTYDLTLGSVYTTADNRFVGTDATLPVGLNYGITVKPYMVAGQGSIPAMGSVSSNYMASIKEGRTGYWGNVANLLGNGQLITGSVYPTYDPTRATTIPSWQQLRWNDVALNQALGTIWLADIGPQNEDLTYSESSSASGQINSYSAAYQYQSGISLF